MLSVSCEGVWCEPAGLECWEALSRGGMGEGDGFWITGGVYGKGYESLLNG